MRLAALRGEEINEAKKVLATETTALVHGRAAADKIAATARTLSRKVALGANLPTVERAARRSIAAGLGVAHRIRQRRARRFAPTAKSGGHRQ